MIVLGIETCTPQTSVAIGTESGPIASMLLSSGRPQHDLVIPAIEQMLKWSDLELSSVGGVAVGVGPGLFTGMRVGIQTAKTLAQVLQVPIVGLASLDVLAFDLRHARRWIGAVIDARRGEVFFSFYRPTPGGVLRTTQFSVGSPEHLAAEIEALGHEILLVGDGALRYRRELEGLGRSVDFASADLSYPQAASMVELSIPRFIREEFDRTAAVVPLYLRKSDAEIAWDRRARTG